MSSEGFHVHGPHDHELEHAAHGNDQFASKIAVMTAIMATVGALFGFQGGATQNDAAMFKNDVAQHLQIVIEQSRHHFWLDGVG